MEAGSLNSILKAAAVVIMMAILFHCALAESGANHTIEWSLVGANVNLSSWSKPLSFFVGDNLVFLYTPNHDVIEVDALDFVTCGTRSPTAAYDDGETVIQLYEAGTRYFICGRSNYCSLGLKLQVLVFERPSPAPTSPSPNGLGIGSDVGEPFQYPLPPFNNFTANNPPPTLPPTPPPFNFTVQNPPPPSPSNLSESGSDKDGNRENQFLHGRRPRFPRSGGSGSAKMTGGSGLLLLLLIAFGHIY